MANRHKIEGLGTIVFHDPESGVTSESDVSIYFPDGTRVGIQLKFSLTPFDDERDALRYLYKISRSYKDNNDLFVIHCNGRRDYLLLYKLMRENNPNFFARFIFSDASR